ncbi:DNA-binding protein [Glaciibacter superstes]|uniref:DNA-binding protein n=1 Tax=Glaciibacter superstes TaxID=501023 RepID=UPI0003B41ABE|nr:DNA-binding protein [Glaciibacter superstes]
MFVITADQVDSRNDRDRAGELIEELAARFEGTFTLPPDQTSGDEIQILIPYAQAALDAVLAIHRTGYWSVGLGIGSVRTPLPAATRQAAGGAFIAARDAVTRAKRADAKFALQTEPATGIRHPARSSGNADASTLDTNTLNTNTLNTDEVEALITMLLLLRQRRTSEGWEVVDSLRHGLAQVDVADRLGISAAAVSQRVKASLWKVEESARPALVRLLENLDHAMSGTEPDE